MAKDSKEEEKEKENPEREREKYREYVFAQGSQSCVDQVPKQANFKESLWQTNRSHQMRTILERKPNGWPKKKRNQRKRSRSRMVNVMLWQYGKDQTEF